MSALTLAEAVARYGRDAYLLTIASDGPHTSFGRAVRIPRQPRGRLNGDCRVLKRRMLIHAGWPRETLLVTVVRDDRGEGHAVLTVITDEGDYILANQKKGILIWSTPATTSSNVNRSPIQTYGFRWVTRTRRPPLRPHANRRFGYCSSPAQSE
jgi:hypothetical protein